MINYALWFMVLQVLTCLSAAIGFSLLKNWPIAWVWFCYGLANIGFVVVAYRG